MPEIFGNTAGLSARSRQTLERIYRRRVPLEHILTPELARSLCDASKETHRQVGALVHRSGTIEWVLVGSATGLMLPDIGRLRAAHGRFRALRLVHTHLYGEPLNRDDLVDLTRLRLDLVCALQMSPQGDPRTVSWAYNIPERDQGEVQGLPYEIGGPVPFGRPLPDFGQLISSLEDEFARLSHVHEVEQERAILIHAGTKAGANALHKANASMRELQSLAHTAGVRVVDTVLQLRDRVDPKLVLGKGKLEEVVMRAIDLDANLLIFDRELSPAQSSGIAAQTDLHVIDRAQLILDIFAQRAETKDGKLQVELAQLKYRLPRLGLKDDALSRLTGGIGGRGPGETKLEIGRRRARERVTRLERELKVLGKQRAERRRRRSTGDAPVLAIVGYTNAGKSTLLNTLTGAGVLAEDKLFATLDTRARQLMLPDGRLAVLADTVGFIREMPKDLFTAFKATFEEAADADLLIEVIDASNPEGDEHIATTDALLRQLGLDALPRLIVMNKLDLLSEQEQAVIRQDPRVVGISASQRESARLLLDRIVQVLAEHAEAALAFDPNWEAGAGTYALEPDDLGNPWPPEDEDDEHDRLEE